MSDPIITPAAVADIDDIWFFIAKDNVTAADREIDLIYENIAHLAKYPQSGHTREDLTRLSLKFWTVHTYFIIYRANVTIEIVRVLHGGRDIESILE